MWQSWLILLAAMFAPDGASWLVQAQKHFEQQQWQEARHAALRAIEVDPKVGDAYVLLGLVATVQSQFAEAETRFSKAVALQPGNPRAHSYLGSTYLQLKRYDEARDAFEQVLKLDPGNVSVHYNLGLIELARERPAEALSHFERVQRAQPSDVDALIGMLESQLMLRRTTEAKASASKLAALLDNRDPRLFQVSTLLAFHGEYAAAIPLMERVRQAHPESYDVSYNLALALFRSEQFDRAREVLTPLLSQKTPAEAYNLLGAVEERLTRIPESIAALRKAAELDQSNEDFRFDYAAAILLYGDVKEAVSAFEAASRDFAASARVRVGLGAAQYLAGNYEPAVKSLLGAVKIDPDARAAYRLLGLSYETAPSLQPDIAAAFAAYLKRRDDDPLAHYHYSAMLDNAGSARLHLKRALELDPKFPEAHLQLGILAQEAGDLPASVAALERAAQLAPELSSVHYRLGLVYQKLGEKDKAKIEFDSFRKLKAANEANERRAIIQSLRESPGGR